MRKLLIAAAASLLAATSVVGQPTPADPAAVPPHVAAALAEPSRPVADRERDARRLPAEILTFAGVQPGDEVADLIMGGGYFTRLLSAAVGPTGRVTAYQPAEFISFRAAYGEEQRATVSGLSNATALSTPLASLALPASLDLVFTAQNYHDLHLRPFGAATAPAVNRAVFTALRPGGVYLIIDHHAAEGSGLRDVDGLHRIDRQKVIDEVTAAGFVLDGESELLRQPADARTVNVFDEAIRGHTDQFVLRFRKPA